MNEQDYLAGQKSVWLHLLREASRHTDAYREICTHAELLIELTEARTALRRVCATYGDNDWTDDLNLVDVIEKHLERYLDGRKTGAIFVEHTLADIHRGRAEFLAALACLPGDAPPAGQNTTTQKVMLDANECPCEKVSREEWIAELRALRSAFGNDIYGDVTGICEPPMERKFRKLPGTTCYLDDEWRLRCIRSWLGPNGEEDHEIPGRFWEWERNVNFLNPQPQPHPSPEHS